MTSKGELETMLQQAVFERKPKQWDGKWRVVFFDIPEGAREIRDKLRKLLKDFGFYGLQASVYVYPYELRSSALDVLKNWTDAIYSYSQNR